MTPEEYAPVLSDPYAAAEWLRQRHPFLAELVHRIAGDSEDWLDEVAGAILDTEDYAAARVEYERAHPRPRDRDDERAYEAWDAAGPENTPRGRAFAVMSGGEVRVVRLVATLANVYGKDYFGGESHYFQRRVPWSVHDVGGWGDRGQAILADWLEIVRAQ